jgi:MoaA/NifB/PqqE/SkfB family radical SAM enzyme
MYLPKNPWQAAQRGIKALAGSSAPMLVQLVVIRRCNLHCGYCNEYDDHSPPVPTEEIIRRIDHVAALGTVVLTLTGGEPLLHPDLDKLVAHAVSRGMVCTSITNGYPVTERWIERLNRAGLSLLQISVDNLEPSQVSHKSLSKIADKFELLKARAEFGVNINAVLGSCSPNDTRRLVAQVERLGFFMTGGLMHGQDGQLDPGLAGDELAALYQEMRARSRKSLFHRVGEGWEDQIIRDRVAADWKCRAGGRYLYVDENGLVSYCSQRRDAPAVALLDYGAAELRAAFETRKGCEARCTIACVRRASALDQWRAQPTLARPFGRSDRSNYEISGAER